MNRLKPALLGATLLACGAMVAPVQAQWNQNASTGPFDYANTANWVGGVVNNWFTSTPASGLNITFSSDYTFSSQVTMGWTNAMVTFRSDSSTPRTLKLSGDFVRTNIVGGIITIGTVANPLILDLNGATRQIGGSASATGSSTATSTNYIYAQIIDSSGGNHGVNLSRAEIYCYLLNDNNSFSGPVYFNGYKGGGFSSIKNIFGGPSALGAPTDAVSGTISVADNNSSGELAYLGTGDTSDRPFQWNLRNNGNTSYAFANRGTGKLTLTGTWTLAGTPLSVNAASSNIELDGLLQGSSTNVSTIKIAGGATKQVFLTNPNNTFQAVEVDSGILVYNSVADPGVPCEIGTGTNIILTGGALQWSGPNITNTRPLYFTGAGPYSVESVAANFTLGPDFVGAETDQKAKTINLNVGNSSTLTVQGAIGDLANSYYPLNIVIGGATGITVANGGTVRLLNPNNSFSGGVQIKYGRTLQVTSLADSGLNCSIGTGTYSPGNGLTAITFGSTDSQRGGILAYIGTTDASCNRNINVLGTSGGQNGVSILNNSPNNSSLHLSSTYWTLDGSSTVMSNLSLVLGGTAITTNILDTAIPNTSLGNTRLTVSGSTWLLTSSQQYLGTTTVTNGTLLLQSTASIPPGGDVTVESQGKLGGIGMISENVTVLPNGSIAPGLGDIGTLTVYGNLTNNGSLVMKVNKAGGTADQISGMNTLVYGGTLVVTNMAGALAAGDTFQLFQASSFVGTFSAISPSTPGVGLTWDLSRLNTGVLGVVSSQPLVSPQITQFRIVPGGTMVFSTSTNSANANRIGYLFASTNLANWTCIRTNPFDANGWFSITNALNPNSTPKQFFRLQVQ